MKKDSSSPHAFTLVELLVAMSLVTLVLAFVVKLSDQVLEATRSVSQQMEASQQGRMVLDSLNADLNDLVSQNGLGLLARRNNGNLELVFLTQSRGPKGAATRFLAVAYLLDGHNLVRRTTPIDWNTSTSPDSALVAVTAPLSTSILATGMLRFDITLTLDDGKVVTFESLPTSAIEVSASEANQEPPFVKLISGATSTQAGAPKISSFTVAVAPLSRQNIKLAEDMGSKLGDLEDGKSALFVWSGNLTPSKLPGVPLPAIAGLQFSQQTYDLK